MQVLVLTRRKLDVFAASDFTPELGELEAQRVRELYIAGHLRSISRRKDIPGAVLIFEAASEIEVRDLVATLPLAQRGMLEIAVLTGLEPYPGFAPR